VSLSKGVHGIAEIAQHVPAVGHLHGVGRTLAGAVRIGPGTVARDDLNAGVPLQPCRQRAGLPVRQQVHDLVALQVVDLQRHRPPLPGQVT